MNVETISSPKRARKDRHYMEQTRRPAFAVFWLLPLSVIYEIWAFTSGNPQARSGLEHLLFSWMGFVPPLVIPGVCLGLVWWWHRKSGDNWEVDSRHLGFAAGEALVLGLMIFFGTRVLQLGFATSIELGEGAVSSTAASSLDWIEQFARYCGAAVVEEVVFRFVLLTGVVVSLNRYLRVPRANLVLAVVSTSLLFSAFHYTILNPAGNPFEWLGFMCRFLVGVAFSLVFLNRGLAIAVLAHLAYNAMFIVDARGW
ncbi:MAG: CPBP family intramembrane metalloprotease [Pirellulaceae bacterium]|nr:CPBP family intramembrane metalloprotease [Pirellulaceae bacterium]